MLPFIIYFGAYIATMIVLYCIYKNAESIEKLFNND